MRPASKRRTKTSVTARERGASIVKYSRDQSPEEPSLRIWRVMVEPDCSFHAHTRSTNASRPMARREVPSASSWRSTTICVAMPAWSVPGCQSNVLLPFMRCQRVSTSMSVCWNAWPMCSVPVTFGGGSWIAKEVRDGSKPALK